MPVITRRQPLLDMRGKTASISLSESLSLQSPAEGIQQPHPWLLAEDSFEAPHKEMAFAAAEDRQPQRQLKSRSHSKLRLTTKSSLHERYQSSEEEASPSPGDYSSSAEDEASMDEESISEPVPALSEDADSESEEDYDTPPTPKLATTVSILYVGRPKLISITAIAPLQKRKRTAPVPAAIKTASTRSNTSSPTPLSPPPRALKRPTHSGYLRAKPAPSIWHPLDAEPTDQMSLSEEEEANDLLHGGSGHPLPLAADEPTIFESDDEIYYPAQLSPTPTSYADYDPYCLDPPSLRGSSDYDRARKFSSTSSFAHYALKDRSMTGRSKASWKGLGKSLGLGKRSQSATSSQGFNAGMEKGKMMARGAAEREEIPVIPAFVFDD